MHLVCVYLCQRVWCCGVHLHARAFTHAHVSHQHAHVPGQAHALLVRMWSADPMKRPLFSEMTPTLDAVLMPRGGGGGQGGDRVELDD